MLACPWKNLPSLEDAGSNTESFSRDGLLRFLSPSSSVNSHVPPIELIQEWGGLPAPLLRFEQEQFRRQGRLEVERDPFPH